MSTTEHNSLYIFDNTICRKAGLSPIAALELIEPSIKAKKGRKYKNSGVLQFLQCK